MYACKILLQFLRIYYQLSIRPDFDLKYFEKFYYLNRLYQLPPALAGGLESNNFSFSVLAELSNPLLKSGSAIQSENFLNPNLLINSSYSC